jgi:ElaB/YqjD/DUF883 family membrane-anchored ribosome-binding protein
MAGDIEGSARRGIDHARRAAGDAVDKAGAKVKGEAREFAAKLDQTAESAKGAIDAMADQARSVVSDVSDRTGDAYELVRSNAQSLSELVAPFVKRRPYATAGVAAITGILLGALLFSARPKVIYVKAPRP